jgi:hypothetical protein
MESVASRDKVTMYFILDAIFYVPHRRLCRVKAVNANLLGAKDQCRPCLLPGVHKISGDLSLSINGNVFATTQAIQVNAMTPSPKAQLYPVMHQAFSVNPRANAGALQKLDGTLLQNSGANTPQNIILTFIFDNDGFNARTIKQLAKQ